MEKINWDFITVTLRYFCKKHAPNLDTDFASGFEKFHVVRNAASDMNEKEIEAVLDYIEEKGLIGTFFGE